MAELTVSYKLAQEYVTTNVYSDGDAVVIQGAIENPMYFSLEAAALLVTAIESVIFDINEKPQQKKDES